MIFANGIIYRLKWLSREARWEKKWNLNDGVELFGIFNYIGLDRVFIITTLYSFQPLNIFTNRISLRNFSDIHLKYDNRLTFKLMITFLLPHFAVTSTIRRNGFGFSSCPETKVPFGFIVPFCQLSFENCKWIIKINVIFFFFSLVHLIKSHWDFLFWTVFVRLLFHRWREENHTMWALLSYL